MRKVRKLTKTDSGSLLINLRELLPENWSYVDVEKIEETKKSVTLKFMVLTYEEPKPREAEQPTPQTK